jgi:hypothetical protein
MVLKVIELYVVAYCIDDPVTMRLKEQQSAVLIK